MQRTLVVSLPNLVDGNVAAWLLRARVTLLGNGRALPARRLTIAAYASEIDAEIDEIRLCVVVPSVRGDDILVEQRFEVTADDASPLRPAGNGVSAVRGDLHPRLSMKHTRRGTLGVIEADIKVIEITKGLMARSHVATGSGASAGIGERHRPSSLGPAGIRVFEVTSGFPRAWVSVGPLTPHHEGAPPAYLALLHIATDPFQSALRRLTEDLGLNEHFNSGGTPWRGDFETYTATLRETECTVAMNNGARPLSRTVPSAFLACAPILDDVELTPSLDFGQVRGQPPSLLRSLLIALWADGALTTPGARDASWCHSNTSKRQEVVVAWPRLPRRLGTCRSGSGVPTSGLPTYDVE